MGSQSFHMLTISVMLSLRPTILSVKMSHMMYVTLWSNPVSEEPGEHMGWSNKWVHCGDVLWFTVCIENFRVVPRPTTLKSMHKALNCLGCLASEAWGNQSLTLPNYRMYIVLPMSSCEHMKITHRIYNGSTFICIPYHQQYSMPDVSGHCSGWMLVWISVILNLDTSSHLKVRWWNVFSTVFLYRSGNDLLLSPCTGCWMLRGW